MWTNTKSLDFILNKTKYYWRILNKEVTGPDLGFPRTVQAGI